MSEPPAADPSPPPTPVFKPNTASQSAKDCALADPAAFKAYTTLKGNTHTPTALGRSWQEVDSMICDCTFQPGQDDTHRACGEGSDCINRLTQVECLETECRCGGFCQNQRFQKRAYSNIEVIQTARKGYGLRAADPIAADAFIYEYVGEVVEKKAFLDRMQKYAEEGIRHFYFMELQKDEYIDATRKGGIGRFANHSCNPNCYVAKWVVGKRMRMGIFAKRNIAQGEELTFNYNVDRYGHDAQPCYCDEPNCVGSIGGKTQTDVAGMDDLFLDALGITAEVESKGLKGSKRKKALKLGEDYMPEIRAVTEGEVPKVVAAARQATSNKPVLCLILQRMKITEDPVVSRRMMRLHGFGMMSTVLKDFADDKDVLKHAFETMLQWPLTTSNKIDDTNMQEHVREAFEKLADDELTTVGEQLLAQWKTLPQAYRIRRKPHIPDAEDDAVSAAGAGAGSVAPLSEAAQAFLSYRLKPAAPEELFKTGADRARFQRPEGTAPAPRGVSFSALPALFAVASYQNSAPPTPQPEAVAAPAPPKKDLSSLLAEAAAAKAESERKASERAEQEAAKLAEEQRIAVEALRIEKGKGREKKRKRAAGGKPEPKGDAALKEKKLLKLVGQTVVKVMSKYKDQMEHHQFKEYAKQCASLIVAREKKSSTFITSAHVPPLSDEKQAKIKTFTKDFAHRVLKKLKAERRQSASVALPTAEGGDGGDGAAEELVAKEIAAEMAAENPDDEDDDDGDDGADGDEAAGPAAEGEEEDGATAAKVSRTDDGPLATALASASASTSS